MPRFIVDTSNEHVVHDADIRRGCHPAPAEQLSLGSHRGCRSALALAVARYGTANGCAFCTPLCRL
ncbi:hypothetical protein OVA14_10085 [Agrococcus sp. SL85]|uniref:hypothetical protein n=1 Tax=Agrococcus sp. SL85 TaxID=2995141 RepID=UPI00226CC8FA|nr:hypothetical protein [Agrococcus sp. SL85]WAC65676.1 hypothetical protein OVA14_10085 [Agrococcus sp. SL85]